jgi:uncharacterized protein YjbI with pentapeptide repeats
MYQHFMKFGRLSVALIALALGACGGGNATMEASRVLQESELYHPVTNPAGVVEQPGQTVVLGLQAGTSDLPPLSNLASKGVEDLWFEVQDAQSMQMVLDADMLAAIDRLEIRDQNDALLATFDAASPSATLSLAPGRYQALLHVSAGDTDPVPVFVQYASEQDDNTRARGATVLDKAQPQDIYLRGGKMSFGAGCPGCNLARKDFSRWNFKRAKLTGANLAEANLTGANLFQADLTGADLSGANLTRALLSTADLTGAKLAGADLSRAYLNVANLTKAVLIQAKLTGANLTSANLSMANFTGANLTGALLAGTDPYSAILDGAILSGAMWNDGRRCRDDSIGNCRQ